METYVYNFDPLKPHFYIVKLGFTWVYIIFLISAQKYRLWVLIRTFEQKYEEYQNFLSENFRNVLSCILQVYNRGCDQTVQMHRD